jgi:SAM-dependent methyltransferase
MLLRISTRDRSERMKEQYYDELLNIHTCEDQKGFNKSFHYHRYEPTPYSALEGLFDQYTIKSSDHIVDFGCGKGRLNFYINYLFNAHVTGVEMNEDFYNDSIENLINYVKKTNKLIEKIHFHCCLAENYQIDALENRFYFFNPFSLQIFMKVVNNILRSVEKSEREVEIILYYPSEDYVFFLENHTSFDLIKEVKLPEYDMNPNERFLIYCLRY